MQIKGKDFIPPTNLLWLTAMGLWGEIQPWRKPESESLAPLLRQTLRRMDLLLLKDAPWPGFDILLGGSVVGEQDFGGGGWGVGIVGRGEQGWCHVPGVAQGRADAGRAESCSRTKWAARVGASPQTVNLSKTNKIRVSRDRKNSWLQVKFSKYF